MSKPIALDICCRKGGATKGLQRAGFHVIGVDIDPQPGYVGDEFWEDDGLGVLRAMLMHGGRLHGIRPDFVWQSWPCQAANTATAGNRAKGLQDEHYQFIPEARELSDRIGIPYVIEQPSSSVKGTIRKDLTLCMDMFKGDLEPPWVMKHRSFELGWWPELRPYGINRSLPLQPKHPKHQGYVRGWRHGVRRDGPYVAGYGAGGGKATVPELQHAMGIDWMTDRFDLCEAIPPAFSEYIGRAFLRAETS